MTRLILPAALLAIRALASLKDLASCDPLRKDTHCPPDPALAGAASFDFAAAGWDRGLLDFWDVDDDTAHDRRRLDFDDAAGRGVAVGVWQPGQAPTVASRKYMLFGKVSVTLQAARGAGLVTALVMKSDSGDEIDWELLGAYEGQASSNYFYNGKALYNTYNTTYSLASSSVDEPHTYAIEWTDALLAFSIDGETRHTWRPGDIPPARWPQTPMRVKLGVWSVAPDSDPGTVAWAGGLPDWSRAPFVARVRSLDMLDYVGRCADVDPAVPVRYRYDERTRAWPDVVVEGCRSRPGVPLPVASAGPPEPSETARPADDDAAAVLRLSSPLAAVVCLGWLLVL